MGAAVGWRTRSLVAGGGAKALRLAMLLPVAPSGDCCAPAPLRLAVNRPGGLAGMAAA